MLVTQRGIVVFSKYSVLHMKSVRLNFLFCAFGGKQCIVVTYLSLSAVGRDNVLTRICLSVSRQLKQLCVDFH